VGRVGEKNTGLKETWGKKESEAPWKGWDENAIGGPGGRERGGKANRGKRKKRPTCSPTEKKEGKKTAAKRLKRGLPKRKGNERAVGLLSRNTVKNREKKYPKRGKLEEKGNMGVAEVRLRKDSRELVMK